MLGNKSAPRVLGANQDTEDREAHLRDRRRGPITQEHKPEDHNLRSIEGIIFGRLKVTIDRSGAQV